MLPEAKKRKSHYENGSDATFFLFAVSNLCMENFDLNMLLPVIHKLKTLKNKQKGLILDYDVLFLSGCDMIA